MSHCVASRRVAVRCGIAWMRCGVVYWYWYRCRLCIYIYIYILVFVFVFVVALHAIVHCCYTCPGERKMVSLRCLPNLRPLCGEAAALRQHTKTTLMKNNRLRRLHARLIWCHAYFLGSAGHSSVHVVRVLNDASDITLSPSFLSSQSCFL